MKKILIVDDDPIVLRTIRALLKEKYMVLITTLPKEALSILDRHTPDMLILDYDMPVLNGLETLELFKQHNAINDIPIVFLTGAENKTILDTLQANSNGILQKPVKEYELTGLLSQYLD